MTTDFCGLCNNKVEEFGIHAYGCKLCPKWIHSHCIFPNASDNDLQILFKYSCGFDVKCLSCKQKSNIKLEQLVDEVKEMKQQLSCNSQCMNGVQKSLKSEAASNTSFEKESSENALNKVIKNSFRNVIQSERDKCDLDESNSVADLDRVVEIGNLINSSANPVEAIRLKSVASTHSRLLKITFLKEQDARNYRLSFEKNRLGKTCQI